MDVRIELVDEATGAVISRSTVPLASLPERFDGMDTTLSVGDAQYSVVHAEPASRAEVERTGEARYTLRKIVMIDPRTILFSLPTIEDVLPVTVTGGAAALQLLPDQYRQVELIRDDQRAEVDVELAEIRRIRDAARPGGGFTEIHVRRGIREPLAGTTLTVDALAAALGATAAPWAFDGEIGVVEHGFALPRAGAHVYGVAPGGVVAILAIDGPPSDELFSPLRALALAHGLILVDWIRAETPAWA